MTGGRKEKIINIFENFYKIRQKIASAMNLPLNEMPLTLSQWQVLSHVRKSKSINVKDLAGLLDVTSSAATQIVDGLVSKGLLKRKRSNIDRRVQEIALPVKALAHMKKRFQKTSHIFDILDDSELIDYCSLTAKLAGKNSSADECK